VKVEVNHVEVAQLGDHAFFGEMSLMQNEKRSATVTAMADTVCLTLARNDFNRLLGPIAKRIKVDAARREEEKEANKSIFQKMEDSMNKGFDSLFSDNPLVTLVGDRASVGNNANMNGTGIATTVASAEQAEEALANEYVGAASTCPAPAPRGPDNPLPSRITPHPPSTPIRLRARARGVQILAYVLIPGRIR
jgi:hypothetical protein